jgi:hypothetical protein
VFSMNGSEGNLETLSPSGRENDVFCRLQPSWCKPLTVDKSSITYEFADTCGSQSRRQS